MFTSPVRSCRFNHLTGAYNTAISNLFGFVITFPQSWKRKKKAILNKQKCSISVGLLYVGSIEKGIYTLLYRRKMKEKKG